MTEKRVTKRDRFAEIREILVAVDATDLVDFVDREVELIDRKRGAARKLTKAQVEGVAIKQDIFELLADGEARRAGEIAKELGDDIAVQRVTALLRQLVADKFVTRVEDEKGVARFVRA